MSEQKTFKPAEVFHVAELIALEAAARGWSLWDFTERIGSLDQSVEVLSWTLYAASAGFDDPSLRVGCHMGENGPMDLERVFGIDAEIWRRNEALWRANPDAHTPLSEEAVEWFGLNDEVPRV